MAAEHQNYSRSIDLVAVVAGPSGWPSETKKENVLILADQQLSGK